MAVDIQIEGVSYIKGANPGEYMTAFEDGQSGLPVSALDVDLDIAVQQPKATFDVVIWNKAIGRPKAGNEVIMYNGDGTREFGGILLQVDEEEILPTIMVYHCTCGDWTKWFDAHLVIEIFNTAPVTTIVDDIVSKYVNVSGTTRTFTTNNVNNFAPALEATPVIPEIQFAYLPPSQCVSQLSQMTGWGFFVDEYRDVNFYDLLNTASPLPNNILNADDLYNTPSDTADSPNWVNLTIGEDVSQIKNRVYITGILIASSQLYSEPHLGDGTTTTFSLNYQAPNSLESITVTVAGTAYIVALDQIDNVPGAACQDNEVFVNFSAQTLRFCKAPASGAEIIVDYYPMTQQAVMEQDQAAITYLKGVDGTDGIREYNRLDPSLSAETPALAQGRAQMTLFKYSMPYYTLQFTSFLGGWRPGQSFTFQSTRRFDGDLNNRVFYVIRTSKKIVQVQTDGDWLWQYTISAASRPFEL